MDGLPEGLSGIKELDLQKGMAYLANSAILYQKILKTFVKTIRADDNKLLTFLSQNDINNFIISVHGYKSSLASIGATELSEKAKELEFAGKENRFDFIEANIQAFNDRLNKLAGDVGAVLAV